MKIKTANNELLELNSDEVYVKGLGGYTGDNSESASNIKQVIDNKSEKSGTVSTVSYDTTNKKLTKTINGSVTDIVTASTIVTDGGGITSHQDISGKVDKVNSATTGNIAKLDDNGNLQDGGISANNVAEKDGTYPNLTAGNLTGPVVQSDAEFTFRKTGGSLSVAPQKVGGAVIQKVKGRTMAWNQLLQSNRVHGNSYSSNGIIWNVDANGVITANGTADGQSQFAIYEDSLTIGFHGTTGHKYYANLLRSGDGGPDSYSGKIIGNGSGFGSSDGHPSIQSCRDGSIGAGILYKVVSGVTVNNLKLYPVLVDLTLLYGSEIDGLTDAEIITKFESEYPEPYYPYHPGKLINNGHRVDYDLVRNQLVQNGNFASTSNWSAGDGITYSVSSNTATLAKTASSYDAGFIGQDLTIIQGHKYYLGFSAKCNNTGNRFRVLTYNGGATQTILAWTNYSAWTNVSLIRTSAATNTEFRLYADNAGSTSQSISVYVKNVVLIDLTLMFGEGNEPQTVEDFEELFPNEYYPYDAGTQQHFHFDQFESGIETVGFNLFDDSTFEVGYRQANGYESDYPSRRISRIAYPCIPNTNYYVGYDGTIDVPYGGVICWYDANMEFISGTYRGSNSSYVHTAPENARYFKMSSASPSGHVWVVMSDSSRNGTYEPYWKETTPINITMVVGRREGDNPKVIFPDGMAGVDDSYDEMMRNRAIKRRRRVNLGDLNWNYVSNDGIFFAYPPSDIAATILSEKAKIVCEKYMAVKGDGQNNTDKTISIGYRYVPKGINIKDSSYNTVSSFQEAISGVFLDYPLETPEEYILDEPLNLDYPVDGGGTERILPKTGVAPFRADIRYSLNGVGTLQRLDDNYVNRNNVAQGLGNSPEKVVSQQAFTRELVDLASRIVLSGVPSDLSYYDVSGAILLKRETSNCYVVRGKGLYKIPLVYGNAIHHGKDNPAAYTRLGSTYTADFVNHLGVTITSPFIEKNSGCTATSAGLLWQTGQSLIDAVDLIDGNDCRYVRFNVANVPATNGKAVLWVKDGSGNIMWSWEIWLCNDDLTPERITNYTGVHYDMMPINLGTIWNAEHTKYISGLYQWGRKDDIGTPAAYNSSTMMTFYDINNNPVTIDNYGVAYDQDTGGTVRSVANSIQMPNKFFLGYDNVNYNWNNLAWFNNFWNAAITDSDDLADNQSTAIKTIYDPSPVGYMLPAGRAFTGFTTTGTNSSTASEFNVVGSFDAGLYFKKDSSDAVGTYFPAAGCRRLGNGSIYSVSSYGYFWVFAPGSQTNARLLYFGSGYVSPLNHYLRADGFSVRPTIELT